VVYRRYSCRPGGCSWYNRVDNQGDMMDMKIETNKYQNAAGRITRSETLVVITNDKGKQIAVYTPEEFEEAEHSDHVWALYELRKRWIGKAEIFSD